MAAEYYVDPSQCRKTAFQSLMQAMKILAIDLGKFKSVACVYISASGEHTFLTIAT